jgi:hypothetical protein
MDDQLIAAIAADNLSLVKPLLAAGDDPKNLSSV